MNTKKQNKILLVEDDALIAILELRQLKNYGYDIIHVLNGQNAIDVVNDPTNEIDLILMDIDLGAGIDGTETAKLILANHDIPVLFLSSHIEREVVEKTENITSYGYVVKNSDITVLDASIKMAFRLHEANHNLKVQKKKIEDARKELTFFEKRYRRLFESAKDGILILDAENGMIVDVNPFIIELLGYSKEQILNKSLWDIGMFKNIEYSKQLFEELQEKKYIRYDSLPLKTFNGSIINVEFVSNVYLVDDEKVIQCNIRDITVRKEYEKTLTNNIQEKESLLKEIQHRTKNSFLMITSLIQLRTSAAHSEETKNVLKEITARVKSISDLYSLLYETDSFYDVYLKIYCNRVINSMLDIAKNIVINKSIDEITVSSKNAAAIGMILVELISNAIKHAFPKSQEGLINIELKKSDSKIVLIVEDDGIGLQNNFNLDRIESMGLHLVKLLAAQLNGKIEFISNNGTKIIIEIPL